MGTRGTHTHKIVIFGDHPHACGDKVYIVVSALDGAGSSPRVWGQVKVTNVYSNDEGIIPTRVGTSSDSDSPQHPDEDHPHACGDKSLFFLLALGLSGSSPRVWGQDPSFCH